MNVIADLNEIDERIEILCQRIAEQRARLVRFRERGSRKTIVEQSSRLLANFEDHLELALERQRMLLRELDRKPDSTLSNLRFGFGSTHCEVDELCCILDRRISGE